MSKSWWLEDAQVLVAEHPETFAKPSKEAIEPLQKGSKAKLIFAANQVDSKNSHRELLWVEILMVQGDKLLGQLEDDPKLIADLKRGELIEFEECHIAESDYVDLFNSTIKV